MTDLEKLVLNIKKYREDKNLTAEKLAFISEISKSELSFIENSLRDPKLSTLSKIASGLDITLKDLFDFSQL